MIRRLTTIEDVSERQLCLGCGACAYVQPDEIVIVDVLDHGRRPKLRYNGADTRSALAVCPGVELVHGEHPPDAIPELIDAWGPVLEVWEGHASDDALRFAGSSGGVASALALYCIESEQMAGVLHIAAREDVAYLNQTVFSTSRDELLAATGSRYAPASPCDRLDLIEGAERPCVFIGKPCDVAGATRAGTTRPALRANLGLTIAIFCAGTPSTRGTLEMIERMGIVDPIDVRSVRYRGNGWPGLAEVRFVESTSEHRSTLTYDQSWGEILQKHRPWRCAICPDHTGEFADVAVGDPWYRPIAPDEPGRSLIVVRTERGRRLVRAAARSRAITLDRVDASIIERSQPNLLLTRGAVWGRLATSRVFGLPVPRYRDLPMFRTWWSELSRRQKISSIAGTARRIVRRRLWKRAEMRPL